MTAPEGVELHAHLFQLEPGHAEVFEHVPTDERHLTLGDRRGSPGDGVLAIRWPGGRTGRGFIVWGSDRVVDTNVTGIPTYPSAHRETAVDTVGSRRVADPYRWLEDPDSPATRTWLAAQDRLYAEHRSGWALVGPMRDRLTRLTAVEDIDADGVLIRRGEAILAGYAGAGRDPAQHGSDADRFDLTRPSRRDHLSFGHGPHYCLGAPLARMEATTALSGLFGRFDLALAVPAEDLEPVPSFIAHGFRTLPVTLDPVGGRQRTGSGIG